jgi:hypothetical protein
MSTFEARQMQRASPSQTNWFDEGGEERAMEAGERGERGERGEGGEEREVRDAEDVEEEAGGGADGVASPFCVVEFVFVTPAVSRTRTLPSTAVSAMELLANSLRVHVGRAPLSLSLSLLQPFSPPCN